MKIAIGLISAIFGMLLVTYGIIAVVISRAVSPPGMTTGEPWGLAILIGVILIVIGCIVYERGIKEK